MSLFGELKRRNVLRVTIAYIVLAWLVMQVADVILNNISAPDWVFHVLLLFLAIGLPFAVFFSWVFEMTPEGLKRESDVDRSQSITTQTGRKLDFMIMGVLVLALGYFAYDKFILDPKRDAALVESMKQAVSEQKPADLPLAQEINPAREGPPMLAVLPFASSSLDGDSGFFASGVHDDLLTQLAQLQSIRVISRTSVLEYRDSVRNIREIGKALGADAILEGGIQSAGEQIRINVQLIDARTDEHLWAQTYDRELSPSNIFEVQTDIARAITSAMQATLTAQEVTQLTVIPTENMAAYRAYRRAMEVRDSTEVFDTIAFRLALEEAVALDPTFTRAWAELAGVLSFENLVVVNPELLQQAEQALEQIKTLAPKSADYLIAQTYYTYYILKNYDRAYQMIKQAQVMRPSDARILELRSWIERRLGDFEGKIESTRQARILDPRNLKWTRNITRDLMMAHHYDEASAEIKDSGFQDYTLSYWNSVLQLKEHRDFARWAEAVAAIQREFSNVEDPYKLWEARIANKDYQAAKDLVHVMQEEWVDGAKAGGVLSSKIRSQIVTYWFLQLNNRLAEVLIEARANLEEGLDTDDDFSRPDAILDMALVTAAEGNTEESERLIRSWERRSAEDFAEMAFSQHRSCRVLGMAGSTAPAIECIRRGLEEPSFVMPFLEPYLPYYDSMRDEPEFIDLLAGLGDAESSP